ncbi:MAG: glycosyltransferase [Mycobacterium sp.]|nr:glycosyltransferase [Mycobacterium sp.]
MITLLLPSLDPARFQVSLICTGEEGGLFSELTAAGVEANALHAGGKTNAIQSLVRVYQHMRRVKPDVVVTQGAGTTLIARVAAILSRVEHRVLWVHNSIQKTPLPHRIADKLLIPATSVFLGVVETQRKYLREECHYPDRKIRIVRNGVDPNSFDIHGGRNALEEFGFGPDCKVVGMVGRLHPVKDHVTLISAARIVLDAVPGTQFLIIGDGPRRSELMELCREVGIEKSVHFTGVRNDIGRLVRAIDVMVLSSHSESLPVTVLEAMACGRPVVGTNVGGMAELVEHGTSGYLVPPRDPEMLARYITDLLRDPELRRKMGAEGRRRVEAEFDLQRCVAAMEDLLSELVTGASLPPR